MPPSYPAASPYPQPQVQPSPYSVEPPFAEPPGQPVPPPQPGQWSAYQPQPPLVQPTPPPKRVVQVQGKGLLFGILAVMVVGGVVVGLATSGPIDGRSLIIACGVLVMFAVLGFAMYHVAIWQARWRNSRPGGSGVVMPGGYPTGNTQPGNAQPSNTQSLHYQWSPATQQWQAPAQSPPVEPANGQPIVVQFGIQQSLTVDPEGIAYQNMRSGFKVAWPELQRVTVTMAYHAHTPQGGFAVTSRMWRIRLVMDAADPSSFAQYHPELAQAAGKHGGTGPGSYGIPLGGDQNVAVPIGQALAAYGGPRFGGVIDEGQVLGFGYL